MDPESIANGEFTFVNQSHTLGFPPRWDSSEPGKLWQYNLHYFEWAWGLDFARAREAALDWMRSHPLSADAVGWEPYPTSLRIQNWLALFLGKYIEETKSDSQFLALLWNSLWRQAEWLSRNVEWRLMANHLFENATTLAVIGNTFEGSDAEHWRRIGADILTEQIPEQILPDGMHFERSPMYHQRILYCMLLLAESAPVEIADLAKSRIPGMLRALRRLIHPDGGIALFGDAALNIYTAPERLIRWAESLGIRPETGESYGAFALPDAGYYGARSREGHYIICSAGPISPGYQPGHAHGDLFSFELSLFGERVICDTGVLSYNNDKDRHRTRSTAAHNTVEVEGKDQSEFWSAFRVGRRAKPRDVTFKESQDGFDLFGSHSGYLRMYQVPLHSRQLEWRGSEGLVITDRVEADRSVHWVARYHFSPDCEWGECSDVSVRVKSRNCEIDFSIVGATWERDTCVVAREFAKPEPSIMLLAKARGEKRDIQTTISFHPGDEK